MRTRTWLPLLLLVAIRAGADSVPTKQEVARALETLDQDPRQGAEKAIALLGEEGSKDSLKALAHYGARTQHNRYAIRVGQELAKKGEIAALALLRTVERSNRKNPQGIARIVTMAEQVPGKSSTAFLLDHAKDRRDPVAFTAVRALGARREETARSVLTSLVKSSRPVVAGAAAFALSRLKPDRATMELLFKRVQKGMKDRIGDSCALALSRMEGAGEFGNRALALALKRSTHDSFHALVKLVLRLAEKPDPELLERALRAPSPRMREVGCDLIGLTRTQGYQDQLLRLAESDHNWRNQVAAWLALRRTGVDEVIGEIADNIRKRGEPSYWAIQCVFKEPPPEVLDVMRDAALDTKDPVRRELAQRALRNAKREAAATREFYLDLWRRGRGTKRAYAALLGLGNLKDVPSFHALVALLEKENEKRFQIQILKGLEKLTGHFYEPKAEIWKDWFQVVGGEVAFDPEPIDRKKNRERTKKIEDLGISPKTEAAVEHGLNWLRRTRT